MSKCRINKYKAGNGTSFSPEKSGISNGSLDNSLAAKLAARDAQDSQLWAPAKQTVVVKEAPPNLQNRANDIHTILCGFSE